MLALHPYFQFSYIALILSELYVAALQPLLQAAADSLVERIKHSNFKGKFSANFIAELALHDVEIGASYAPGVTYDTFKILDAIQEIENKDARGTRAKEESDFKKPILRGLKHKHHIQARYIPLNVYLELMRKESEWVWEKAMAEVGVAPDDSLSPEQIDQFSKLAVYYAVHGMYEQRASRKNLTGEWIVYASIDGQNYYLTLASHREPDTEILKRVQGCFFQFPELKEYLDRFGQMGDTRAS